MAIGIGSTWGPEWDGFYCRRFYGHEYGSILIAGAPPIPGVGPVLQAYFHNGIVYATRNNGESAETWKLIRDEWHPLTDTNDFPDAFSGADNTGLCSVREWAAALLEHQICGEHVGEIHFHVGGSAIHLESVITHIDGKRVGRTWKPPLRHRIKALFAPLRIWWLRRGLR